MGCVQFEEGPDLEAEGAFYSRDKPWTLGGGWWQWPLYSMDKPLYFEADGEQLRVEAAMRATADPLPLAAGQWQGGTENLTGLFLNESSK